MTIKNYIISGAIALVMTVGVFVVVHPTSTTIVKTVDGKTVQVGGASSPDISSPYISVNNLQTWSALVTMVQNASTTCNYQTPNATTTITAFSYRFGLASTSAALVEMGKSTSPDATTTLFGTAYNIAAGAQATVEATSTAGAAADAMILAPNTWLAVKIGGGALGTIPTGSCSFEVQALQ